MTSIIYVGMDVHTTNYTLCCYSMEDDRFFAEVQVEPDAKNILKYLARIEKQQSRDCRIVSVTRQDVSVTHCIINCTLTVLTA